VNTAAGVMFGYEENKLLGRSVNKLMVNPPSSMKELCERYHRPPTLSPVVVARNPVNSPGESMRVVRAKHRVSCCVVLWLLCLVESSR